MSLKHCFISVLLVLNLPLYSHALTQCGPECPDLGKRASEKQVELARIRIILAKNEDLLKANAAASPSLLVKLRSSAIMSKLRIETLQNENQVIGDQLKAKGCQSCLVKTISGS